MACLLKQFLINLVEQNQTLQVWQLSVFFEIENETNRLIGDAQSLHFSTVDQLTNSIALKELSFDCYRHGHDGVRTGCEFGHRPLPSIF